MCVDSGYKNRDQIVGLHPCASDSKKKAEQNFTLTWHKDIRVKGKSLCFDVSDPNDKADIVLYPCHGMQGNQYWKYDVVSLLYNFEALLRMFCPVKYAINKIFL